MSKQLVEELSRRERQIMELVYERGEATAVEIQAALPDPPSNSAVRALLSLLKKKGLVRYRKAGRTYIYSPVVSRDKAKKTVLDRVLQKFFANSVESVVATLIDLPSRKMSEEELARLEEIIRRRRRGGKSK